MRARSETCPCKRARSKRCPCKRARSDECLKTRARSNECPRTRARSKKCAASGILVALLLAGCGPQDRSAPGLYADYCQRCHAKDGKGDPRSINLYPNLDLTHSQLAQHRLRGAIYRRIADGYGPMPAFSHRLERNEIEGLVDLTLRFQSAAPNAQATRRGGGTAR
jgi:cytochrome c553